MSGYRRMERDAPLTVIDRSVPVGKGLAANPRRRLQVRKPTADGNVFEPRPYAASQVERSRLSFIMSASRVYIM